jgi:hypothetical protein
MRQHHSSHKQSICTLSILVLSYLLLLAQKNASVDAVRSLRIVSPLQSLTLVDRTALSISDDDDKDTLAELATPRRRFLARFRAGLTAEHEARQALQQQETASGDADKSSNENKDWALQAAQRYRRTCRALEHRIESAFTNAVSRVEAEQQQLIQQRRKQQQQLTKSSSNHYQFVGVIQPPTAAGAPIVWYARPKPAHAPWSVRLIHVNRGAVWYDLFRQGQVDIFAQYTNASNKHTSKDNDNNDDMNKSTIRPPTIERQYFIRPRTWK